MTAHDPHAFPVSTYADALRWLFTYSQVEEWAFDRDADLPAEARLVCDMFWITASDLRRDISRDWLAALVSDRPAGRGVRPRRWVR